MVERTIKAILDAGIAYFQADSRRISTLFVREFGLEETEAANIRAYFDFDPSAGEPGGPPTVNYGYPRQSGPFPAWSIVLGGDTVRQRYIGDDLGTDTDELAELTNLDGEPALGMGWFMQNQIDIYSYVLNVPDVCLYYYWLLRFLIMTNTDVFDAAGYTNLELTGQEIAPDLRYLPEGVWIRRMRVTVETNETWFSEKGKAARISGAFVAGGPEDDDDGLTEPREITPYVAE